MTQECIRCHKQKDLRLFKQGNKTCKLCKWFEKHTLEVPDYWDKKDVKYVIEQIHDAHTIYLNDIADSLNRPLNDIIVLLRDKLKLTNIRNQKIRVRSHCDNCNKEIETFICKLKVNNFNFCSHKCYSEFRSKYYIGERLYNTGTHLSDEQKEQCRINTVKCYAEGKINRNTKPQRMINNLLTCMNIAFENEKSYKYYSVDNYLKDFNLIIEVMGDYFHANPIKYKFNLSQIQNKDVIRDKRKHTYINKYYNIEILYLWEDDILKDIDKCKYLINEYINNKGVLKNYNSYNYQLKSDKLILKENIINPYFI